MDLKLQVKQSQVLSQRMIQSADLYLLPGYFKICFIRPFLLPGLVRSDVLPLIPVLFP